MLYLSTPSRSISWWVALALLFTTLAVTPAALADPPDDLPGPPAGVGQELGEEKAAAAALISAEHRAFAEQAAAWAAEFAELVQEWTSCVREAASSNESNQDSDEVVYPLEACGDLQVDQSPGHRISSEQAID